MLERYRHDVLAQFHYSAAMRYVHESVRHPDHDHGCWGDFDVTTDLYGFLLDCRYLLAHYFVQLNRQWFLVQFAEPNVYGELALKLYKHENPARGGGDFALGFCF